MEEMQPQFPTKGIILICQVYYSYLLNVLAVATRVFELWATDEQFRGHLKILSNLTKQADLESCLRLRLLMDREYNIEQKYTYLWDHLEKYIKMNVEEGLIRSDEVNLIMGLWNGKTLLSYWDDQIDFSKILKKYPTFQWGALAFLHISDLDLFQDIKEHNRKILKAKEDLRKVNSLEERRQIERLIVLEAIAIADFKMAILILSQISLSPKFNKEPPVNQIWIIHLVKIEKMLRVRLNIKNFFS